MIKRLLIKNFKPIEELDLELRPITVLCGPNSVGKSSIGQALLFLKQSKEQYGSVSLLRPVGNLVDLGGYPDFIHKHDENQKFSFEVMLDLRRWRAMTRPKGFFSGAPPEVRRVFENLERIITLIICFSYKYNTQKEEIELCEMKIESNDGLFHIESKINPDNTYRFAYRLGERRVKLRSTNPHFESLVMFLGPFMSAKAFQKKISDYKQERIIFLNFITSILINLLNQELDELSYLGPFREPPQRFYTTGGAKPEGIGTRGQLTIDYLTYSSVSEKDGLVKFAKDWLNEFGYASDFSIDRVHGLIRTTSLKNKSTGIKSTLLDVGFGISQVLPVIVATYLHKRGLHIFEQPEIHLHPASQADLADLFIETITDDKQYLIETHSEHFLNRIRRRIVEGERIDPDKVIVYYMRYVGSKLKVERIFVEKNGSYRDIPDDFFGEALSETRAIMEARKQRKLL